MKFNRESLPSVLKKIERTTDYKFVFAYNDVSNYTVTGELKKASIDEAMTYLLADKPLGYTVKGKIVNVTKKDRKAISNRTRKVSGYVTDENGFGKRSSPDEYRVQGRAGMGVKAGVFNEETGKLVCLKMINADNDIMIIADNVTV